MAVISVQLAPSIASRSGRRRDLAADRFIGTADGTRGSWPSRMYERHNRQRVDATRSQMSTRRAIARWRDCARRRRARRLSTDERYLALTSRQRLNASRPISSTAGAARRRRIEIVPRAASDRTASGAGRRPREVGDDERSFRVWRSRSDEQRDTGAVAIVTLAASTTPACPAPRRRHAVPCPRSRNRGGVPLPIARRTKRVSNSRRRRRVANRVRPDRAVRRTRRTARGYVASAGASGDGAATIPAIWDKARRAVAEVPASRWSSMRPVSLCEAPVSRCSSDLLRHTREGTLVVPNLAPVYDQLLKQFDPKLLEHDLDPPPRAPRSRRSGARHSTSGAT